MHQQNDYIKCTVAFESYLKDILMKIMINKPKLPLFAHKTGKYNIILQ